MDVADRAADEDPRPSVTREMPGLDDIPTARRETDRAAGTGSLVAEGRSLVVLARQDASRSGTGNATCGISRHRPGHEPSH